MVTKALGVLEFISSTFNLIETSSPTIPNLGDSSMINLLSFSSLFPVIKKFIGAKKFRLLILGVSLICPSEIIIAPANLLFGISPIKE